MEKLLSNILGDTFRYKIALPNEVSTLSVGYIITPSGEFIEVKDDENHAEVFSYYLDSYLCRKEHKYYDTLEAAKHLTIANHIVYLGLKTEEIKDMSDNLTGVGYGIFLLPDDYENTITFEQSEACLTLIKTNKSLFGNYEKLELQFNKLDGSASVDRDDFMSVLEICSKKNKSK